MNQVFSVPTFLKCATPVIAILLSFSFSRAQDQPTAAAVPEWPKTIVRDGATNTVYQPQLESWDGFTLKALSAVSIQPAGAKQATFGAVSISAQARVDKAERLVHFDSIQLTEAKFPSAPDKAEKYLATLRSLVPKEVKTISLDRIEASLAILEEKKKAALQPLQNEPPAILFASKPAMLIAVDGEPIYRKVEGTEVERIFNTHALIVREKTGKHYLHFYDSYVEAPELMGAWTVAATVPKDVKEAEKQAVKAKQVDLLAGQENPETGRKPSLRTTPVPELRVVTTPTELVVTDGAAQWSPIPPTQLLFIDNTKSHVFKSTADQKTYILISGRWFRSDDGTKWEHVPGADLPKDFANIPNDHIKENVKASVPETQQAVEAEIANGIPQTTKIKRAAAKMDPVPSYEGGAPQLEPIEDTTLQYAVNSATPVINVDEETWYACQNSVWYGAASAEGPWVVADTVPAVIYSIPPSSPLHYVTYVRVYNADEDYIWVGATPGYYGTVVDSDGIVVYGTGYSYPSYVGSTVYVSYPVTYGYDCNPCWTPWVGWGFGFAAGWALGDDWDHWAYCPPAPYWGAYGGWCYGARYNAYGGVTAWGPYGWAGTSGYAYHQAGSWSGLSRGSAGFNAWTGNQWAAQYGRAYNSATGTRVAGRQGTVQNVYTGRYASGARGAAVHEGSGAVAAGRRGTAGNVRTGESVSGGRGVVYNPATGRTTAVRGVRGDEGGVANINGHVVAAKDGNVYRGNANGDWNSVTHHGQQPRTTAVSQQQLQSFNNQAATRNQGAQRQAAYQSHQPSFSGGARSGGGARGGGGGRRR